MRDINFGLDNAVGLVAHRHRPRRNAIPRFPI